MAYDLNKLILGALMGVLSVAGCERESEVYPEATNFVYANRDIPRRATSSTHEKRSGVEGRALIATKMVTEATSSQQELKDTDLDSEANVQKKIATDAIDSHAAAMIETKSDNIDGPSRNQADDAVPELSSARGVSLNRMMTTSDIVSREPESEQSVFAVDNERIYAFLDVANESDESVNLVVRFFGPNGEVTGDVFVEVPPNVRRWRTWAYSSHVHSEGDWYAEVRLDDGEQIGRLAFVLDSICC
ncbi:MAG: DUF2914 domain-containing protein [Polyangiales bacterium]